MKGFTLVEVLIGTFLILLVFLGIFGAFQLSLEVVSKSRARIIATALANQQIEKVRNLTYESVGVQGGFPDGALQPTRTIVSNKIKYTVETRIDFVVDATDGIAQPEDECPNDYKKVQVTVSWPGAFGGKVVLITDVAPQNLAQECASGGGILYVSVFDAYGQMVPSPLIEIFNPATGDIIKTATPLSGKHYFALAPALYKVRISKEGYSIERTYGTDEITTPEKPHPLVIGGQLVEISLSIDKVSSFSVGTYSPWGMGLFSDSFSDESKISQISDVIVSGGKVTLAKTDGDYKSSGFLVSTTISPENLISWGEFSFSDTEPLATQINYQFLYFDGANWFPIPNSDLPGNAVGFGDSPVDLSGLATTTYSQLKVKGNLSTQELTVSPSLYDWEVSWLNSQATPIPNTTFHLEGKKVIGLDIAENPVYKYSKGHSSDSQGHIDISNLEWDSYTFSLEPATGLDLRATDPSPQPINLSPDTNLPVSLYLEAENSLLLTVQNTETTELIFAAEARLYNAGLDYDITQYTNEKGQTYFIPLESGNYTLEVRAPGYLAATTTIAVSGDITKTVGLVRVE